MGEQSHEVNTAQVGKGTFINDVTHLEGCPFVTLGIQCRLTRNFYVTTGGGGAQFGIVFA